MAKTTILKYPIPTEEGEFKLELHSMAQMIHVGEQNGKPFVWIQVDHTMPKKAYEFRIVFTGIAEYLKGWKHDGSVWLPECEGGTMLHVFHWTLGN